jgi:hypothetical protein
LAKAQIYKRFREVAQTGAKDEGLGSVSHTESFNIRSHRILACRSATVKKNCMKEKECNSKRSDLLSVFGI